MLSLHRHCRRLAVTCAKNRFRSTTSSGSHVSASGSVLSGSDVYETDVATNEYLQFHYATNADLCPFAASDSDEIDSRYADALGTLMEFPVVCASKLAESTGTSIRSSSSSSSSNNNNKRGGRALDVGCSVGRTSFELTKAFDAVVGLDFSQAFIDTANEMKSEGQLPYTRIVSGDVIEEKLAAVPEGVSAADRQRVEFHQGDACALDAQALGGAFDGVVAANLLCRLPEPLAFLQSMEHVVNPGGSLVLISPYSWLEEYTNREKWIGWRHGGQDRSNDAGAQLESFEEVREVLAKAGFELQERTNIPFVMREHRRKYQLGISECTSWKRR